jgi:opacity protein-like surface antigen
VAGVLQGGGGVYLNIKKGLTLRGEYRFQHASDPFNANDGINSHTLVLGVLF